MEKTQKTSPHCFKISLFCNKTKLILFSFVSMSLNIILVKVEKKIPYETIKVTIKDINCFTL